MRNKDESMRECHGGGVGDEGVDGDGDGDGDSNEQNRTERSQEGVKVQETLSRGSGEEERLARTNGGGSHPIVAHPGSKHDPRKLLHSG